MCRRGSVIGVVAIGRNEGERLVACLQSVSTLGLPMVYVDSASTDGSQAIAREVGAVVVELDLARPFTAARARHEGAQALLAAVPGLRYVQFIDGDCVVGASLDQNGAEVFRFNVRLCDCLRSTSRTRTVLIPV